jgi:hypothetical protein
MSTRATYRFASPMPYKPAVTMYIHHDGYPEGAVQYLLAALQQGDGYLSAESFIRANGRAELCSSHQSHGDTEYRYEIDVANDHMVIRERIAIGHDKFTAIFAGSIAEGMTFDDRI